MHTYMHEKNCICIIRSEYNPIFQDQFFTWLLQNLTPDYYTAIKWFHFTSLHYIYPFHYINNSKQFSVWDFQGFFLCLFVYFLFSTSSVLVVNTFAQQPKNSDSQIPLGLCQESFWCKTLPNQTYGANSCGDHLGQRSK